ncbi:phage protein NinX family protein [Ectopseudomonas mendocina]|uniref:Phage protein NinX family protein n=1 Tax=Ectopseudomonas mendocina TaxID=300 RepID=A0ABZ2RQR6_ECTME
MKSIPVSELTGAALDWAVALALGWKMRRVPRDIDGNHGGEVLAPPDLSKDFQWPPRGWIAPWYFIRPWSSEWAQGGPLVHKYQIELKWMGVDGKAMWWMAGHEGIAIKQIGDTPLIAACRAIVASKFGDTVEVPSN